jgi:hypothetical protein
VFLIGEDLREPWEGPSGSPGLSTDYGDDRVLNTPISENGFLGVALGCAINGLRPVVEIMHMDFAMMAMDQLTNQIPKIRYMTGGQVSVPLVVRTPGGGYRSSAAQHGQCLEAMFAHLPGWLIAAPATPADARALKTASVTTRYCSWARHLHAERQVSEGGTSAVRRRGHKRVGTDCTIVAWSRMVLALRRRRSSRTKDLGGVIDLRTLVPWDEAADPSRCARPRRGSSAAGELGSGRKSPPSSPRGFHYLKTGIVAWRAATFPFRWRRGWKTRSSRRRTGWSSRSATEGALPPRSGRRWPDGPGVIPNQLRMELDRGGWRKAVGTLSSGRSSPTSRRRRPASALASTAGTVAEIVHGAGAGSLLGRSPGSRRAHS